MPVEDSKPGLQNLWAISQVCCVLHCCLAEDMSCKSAELSAEGAELLWALS